MLQPTARFFVHFITTVLTMVMVLFATMIALLARGPISLDLLSPYLAEAMNDADAPVRIDFDDTVLAWDSRGGRLDIRVLGLRVSDANGERLASAPQVSVRLRAPALLELRIEPEQLVLLEPKLRLTRDEQGRFELGLGGGGDAEAQKDVLASWLRGDWPGFTRTLERLRVHEAELVFDDRLTGRLWRAPSAGLSMHRGADGVRLAADAKMVIADRPARVALTALYVGPERPLTVDVDFQNVEPAILALETGIDMLQPLGALRMGFSGRLDLELDAEMRLQTAAFELASGKGILVLPEHYGTPLTVAGVMAAGRFTSAPETVEVSTLVIELERGRQLRFEGRLVKTEAGIGIGGAGTLERADVEDLRSYWPATLKPNSREWVMEHIADGQLSDVRVQFDVRPGELDAPEPRAGMAVLEFKFSDVTCRYWRPLPALTRARGSGRIDAKTLDVRVEAGQLDKVAASDGRIRIAHDVPDPKHAEIEFLATGSARAMLDILDRKPLELTSKLGIDTGSAGGEGVMRVRLDVPLLKDVPLRDIGYAASGSLREFSLAGAFGAYDLGAGDLSLEVTREGVSAKGTVALNQVPMSITWQHDFADQVSHPNRYGMAAVLDERRRQALGIRLEPYLAGESRIELQIAKDRAGRYEVQGRADLGEARLSLPQLKWSKPPGQAAGAEFRFAASRDSPIEVSGFRIESDGFTAAGRARVSDGGNRVVFDRLRFAGHDFAADVNFAGERATTIALSGKALDLRDLLAADEARSQSAARERPAGIAPLKVAAKLERVIVSDSFWLQDVEGSAVRQGGSWLQLSATGGLNGGSRIELAMQPDEGGYQNLTVDGRDAGSVFAATGFVTGISGGTLQLRLRIPDGIEDDKTVTGSLVAEEFRLVNAPILTKVLTLGSVTGIRDLLDGAGIQFKRLQADFVKEGDVIRLESVQAAGPAIGFTMSGVIDRGREQVELNGAVVPAYTINSALGGVPLFGPLLVGREGEGVFAIDYRITGPIDDPVVNVNPLSVLAPGALRRLVETLGGPITVEPPESGVGEFGPQDRRP